jgi:hypothetical protein
MKFIAGLMFLSALYARAADPSAAPCPDPTGKAKYVERYRIVVDLDGDGMNDMLLSGKPDAYGKMGVLWTVFLDRAGNFTAVGTIVAHPAAIAFESDSAANLKEAPERRFVRIWVYHRAGGSSGGFGYYRVGADSVDEMRGIEIYPGDGGSDLGRAIYKATFERSPIPFILQQSSTGDDGVVTWKETEA